jgi:hypothetical protein
MLGTLAALGVLRSSGNHATHQWQIRNGYRPVVSDKAERFAVDLSNH